MNRCNDIKKYRKCALIVSMNSYTFFYRQSIPSNYIISDLKSSNIRRNDLHKIKSNWLLQSHEQILIYTALCKTLYLLGYTKLINYSIIPASLASSIIELLATFLPQ